MHTFRYNYSNVSVHTISYMFHASLAHHQGFHSCIIQSLDLIIICNMWNGRRFIDVRYIETDMCTVIGAACRLVTCHTQTYRVFQLLCTYPP